MTPEIAAILFKHAIAVWVSSSPPEAFSRLLDASMQGTSSGMRTSGYTPKPNI